MSRANVRLRLLLALAAALLGIVIAPAAPAQESLLPDSGMPPLKAGQFVWLDQSSIMPISTGTGISIVVSIPQQMAFVYRDGALIAVSTVSTGKEGKDTPVGEFTILQKQVFHRSNLYSAAPMPFMQRLTWDGIALHAGHLPGYPASHGCIRLPAAFAKQLYGITDLGASVSVIDYPVYEPFTMPERPTLIADMRDLGGDSFNVVTVREQQPPSLIKAVEERPASWVMGPAREVVQPLPGGTRN